MAECRPHRGQHPYVRHVEKAGLGLFNSRGWQQAAVIEIEGRLPNGRPAFFQFNVCGERNMLVNVYVPKAWAVPHTVARPPDG